MKKKFLYWWTVFVLQLTTLIVCVNYNLHVYVWQNDITYISFFLLFLYIIISIVIGLSMYKNKESNQNIWLTSDYFMTIGMIGTVIGFMIMTGNSFHSIDLNNLDTIKNAMISMTTGISTALITTLSGLIFGLYIKIQLMVQDG